MSIPPLTGFSSARRALVLAFLSVLFLCLFFALPTNRVFRQAILDQCRSVPRQWHLLRAYPDPEQRMRVYHGANYTVPAFLRDNLTDGDVVLLPPRDYLLRFFPADQVLWADPRVIYYMVGRVRSLTVQSPDWESATHAAVVEVSDSEPSVRLVSLTDPGVIEEIRRIYFDASSLR